MEIKDYINKNLTNLNWNILPQIFEENDVELTEEIEAYLRNTPENTNWNVFEGMSEGGSDEWVEPDKGILVFSGKDEDYENTPITIEEGSNFQTVEQLISWCFNGKHNVESDLEVKRIGYEADPITYIYNSSGSTDATKIFKYDWYSELYIETDQVYLYTDGG